MHEGRGWHGFGTSLVESRDLKWLERLQCRSVVLHGWHWIYVVGLIGPQWWLGWMMEDPLSSLQIRLGEASTRGGVYVGSYGSEERLLSLSLGVLDLLLDPGCLTVDVSEMLFKQLRPYLLVVELANDAFVPGSSRRIFVRSVGSRWRRSIFVVVWMTLHTPWNRWEDGLWGHRGCVEFGLSCGPCFFSLFTLCRLIRSDTIARTTMRLHLVTLAVSRNRHPTASVAQALARLIENAASERSDLKSRLPKRVITPLRQKLQ